MDEDVPRPAPGSSPGRRTTAGAARPRGAFFIDSREQTGPYRKRGSEKGVKGASLGETQSQTGTFTG